MQQWTFQPTTSRCFQTGKGTTSYGIDATLSRQRAHSCSSTSVPNPGQSGSTSGDEAGRNSASITASSAELVPSCVLQCALRLRAASMSVGLSVWSLSTTRARRWAPPRTAVTRWWPKHRPASSDNGLVFFFRSSSFVTSLGQSSRYRVSGLLIPKNLEKFTFRIRMCAECIPLTYAGGCARNQAPCISFFICLYTFSCTPPPDLKLVE